MYNCINHRASFQHSYREIVTSGSCIPIAPASNHRLCGQRHASHSISYHPGSQNPISSSGSQSQPIHDDDIRSLLIQHQYQRRNPIDSPDQRSSHPPYSLHTLGHAPPPNHPIPSLRNHHLHHPVSPTDSCLSHLQKPGRCDRGIPNPGCGLRSR